MLRGAVAYGPIFEGTEMQQCNIILENDKDYSRHVVVGPALSNAYNGERKASPFGVWIHETARTFAPAGESTISKTHWQWWNNPIDKQEYDRVLATTLAKHLAAYLEWCEKHSSYLLYEKQRICEHRMLMEEYFEEMQQGDQQIALTKDSDDL